MRYEQTTTVDAGTADAVFAYVAGQLLQRDLPVEVDDGSRTAVWGSAGGDCAGQLYVTDARPRGVRVTVAVETHPAAAARVRAELDQALAALAARR
ncbi:hypothetical protein ACQEU8_05840 [Streptomyces sp. CA-250714]|uniref:hypothetical protein n=1 Tax=Streptomyces sp. CA-250714 TaxID=3240060 RepID=UPI003D8D4D97